MIGVPPGWRLRVHESLTSTSDLLLRLAAAGEPEGLAVLARRQTGGRGRDGRRWESPAGNMYLSVLLRPAGPAREAGQWSLLAAVALADALAGFAPDPTAIALKWPNDVLLDEAKLAGLICESAADAEGRMEWLVIGLGANLAVAPALEDRATTCLGAVPPEDVAVALLAALDRWRRAWLVEGFGAIRTAWMARGPKLDAHLAIRGSIAGRYAGLAEDGSLLLATGGRVHAIASGEIAGAG
ncbi:biotin--[acetyl-CoA-carboxylase] ligase [Falsiroseomonas sp. E2-1-a20]|uniref:biotin--[acetyl-CoA-carboxylase] ligase n=1 Tax=Falsiroseomonas sp. E2-1-a20 TaxID=3239300 RepID=UPI003F4076BF